MATAVSGHNVITGEDVGVGGRLLAAAGAVTPFSGGQIRGGVRVGSEVLGAAGRAIQRFADRVGVDVAVIGSRARGTAGPLSDYDYVVGGGAAARRQARQSLPRGSAGGELGPGGPTGIDVFRVDELRPLGQNEPFVLFRPQGGGQ